MDTEKGLRAMEPSDTQVIRWVRSRTRKYLRHILVLTLTSLSTMIALAVSPFLIRQFIDNLTRGVFSLPLAIGVIGLSLADLVVNTYNRYVVQAKQQEGAKDLAGEVYAHLQSLPFPFFRANPTGELMSKTLDDTTMLGQHCVLYYPMLFVNLLALLVSTTVLCLLEWRLALIALAFFPLGYLSIRYLNWRQRQAWAKEREGYARTVESLREKIEGMAIIERYQENELFKRLFFDDLTHWFRSLQRALLYEQVSSGVFTNLPGVLGIGLLILGALWASFGWTSLGAVIAFFWYLGNLYAPIAGLVDWNNGRQQVIPMGKRVVGLLAVKPKAERHGLPLPPFPAVILSNISAGYDGKDVLRDINLEVRCGQMTALVGDSGSGKSTLVSLLLEFNQPTQGEIVISGRPLGEYGTRELREGIAFSSSEAFLFNMTIRDNIALGGEYTDEEITAAAKIAGIHEFVAGLPQGYDTVVGERGTRLSDGERQRIALARAVIKRPQILILDEATAGVDSRTESQIYERIRELGVTLIVVAHRLSTIHMADRIYLLDGGTIACQGTHVELLDRCPGYRALFEKQLVHEVKAAHEQSA